jgi:hypothetical protein
MQTVTNVLRPDVKAFLKLVYVSQITTSLSDFIVFLSFTHCMYWCFCSSLCWENYLITAFGIAFYYLLYCNTILFCFHFFMALFTTLQTWWDYSGNLVKLLWYRKLKNHTISHLSSYRSYHMRTWPLNAVLPSIFVLGICLWLCYCLCRFSENSS